MSFGARPFGRFFVFQGGDAQRPILPEPPVTHGHTANNIRIHRGARELAPMAQHHVLGFAIYVIRTGSGVAGVKATRDNLRIRVS